MHYNQHFSVQVKCHHYWPNSGSCSYGNIKVTLRNEEQLTNYCWRQFIIQQVLTTVCFIVVSVDSVIQITGGKDETHLIHQFHFTVWPDHGVPKHATALLEFHKKIDKHHKRKSNRPMLVHCRYAAMLQQVY